ncbi:MAG: hypothetical protein CM1200mP1_10560 [Candidatus Neomarinimicrobiota bacterium]|nr:MAG: hypothetical protein CM1200mP1_10560 [Candidatus Neomarinimicrobiota bacterium]
MSNPLIAIVGRPNVGKSTFFNRVLKQRKAIVDSQEGITRDRIYGEMEWVGHNMTFIDTGGYIPKILIFLIMQLESRLKKLYQKLILFYLW